MAEKITVAELNINTEAFLKAAEQTKIAIDKIVLAQKGLEAQGKKNSQEYIKNEADLKKLSSAFVQQKNAIIAMETPYAKLSRTLIIARNNAKNLAVEFGINSKQARAATAEVQIMDAQLKKVDKSVGQGQRTVGLYSNAIKGMASSFLGITAVIYGFVRVLKDAFGIVTQFEKANAELAAILQKTTAETKALRDNAEDLGASTAKTATEVVNLQIAFARLGFTQSEILDLTEATIAGSIAMNSELSATANLVGAVVRSMDSLSSTDAPFIIDVMALATAKSALNFEKLNVALPIVLGAANALEIPFTKVIATLGKLSDSGIDASTSATALRNIYIESAARGIDYEDALIKISQSTNKLTTANEIFGKRAAVSALIISNNTEKLNELDVALQKAKGTAQEMADKQLNTLSGKTTLLTSAWQGFILSIENGEGVFSKAIKSMIDGTTDLLSELKNVNQITEILNQEDLSSGIFKFLGIPMLDGIKNTAKASAQLQLLNEDYKAMKSEGIDELTNAYGFYEDKITEVGKTDANHTKLLEFQLGRIEELIKSKNAQIAVDEAGADLLFEQKQGIIDILIESDKKLKANELERKSIEELNNILNISNEAENERIKKSEESRKKEQALILKDTETFNKQKQDLENEIALAKTESDKEKDILESEQKLQKDLLDLENLRITETQKHELKKLIDEEHRLELAEINAEYEAIDAENKAKKEADEAKIEEEKRKKQIALQKQFNKEDLALDKVVADAKKSVSSALQGALGKILGDGLASRLLSIILGAKAEIAAVNISTAAAQARNMAAATAVGFPANLATIPPALVQNAALAGKAAIATGRIITASAISAATSAFYEGGQVPNGTGGVITGQNIPTQQGGDNILATVKSGEVILNENQQARAGGSAFFKSIGVPGFNGGGNVTPSSISTPIQQTNSINEQFDILAQRINDIKIVTVVDDVTTLQAQQTEIRSGANI